MLSDIDAMTYDGNRFLIDHGSLIISLIPNFKSYFFADRIGWKREEERNNLVPRAHVLYGQHR